MKKTVRQADIAEALGVSIVTVSKALAGKSGVGPALREEILKKAKELGYENVPGSAARYTGNFNLALIFHEKYVELNASFYSKLTHQITLCAMNAGCYIMSEIISRDMEQSMTLPRLVSESKVEGVIVLGHFAPSYIDFLSENLQLPFILLDNYGMDFHVDSIISDSYYGAYTATNYLFGMGHKKIAYVGTLLQTGSITDRYLGYRRSMIEHGQSLREDYVVDDRGPAGVIYPADMLQLPADMPTAFFCNCDITASVLIRRLKNEGLRVPDDVSVVGFDNFIYPGACDIEITSYEVDIDRMAKCAVNLISKKIRGVYYRKGLYIMEGHMVLKNSVSRISG